MSGGAKERTVECYYKKELGNIVRSDAAGDFDILRICPSRYTSAMYGLSAQFTCTHKESFPRARDRSQLDESLSPGSLKEQNMM